MDDKEDKTKEDPSFEIVLEKLGAVGRFQVIQITLNYMCMFLTPAIILSFVFEGYAPPHVCNAVNETDLLSSYARLQNDSTAQVLYEQCQIKIVANQNGSMREVDSINCPNGRNFSDAKHTTFLSDWDLVCESRGIAELSQTCFNVGQLIGALVGSAIADRLGRKPVFILSSFVTCILELCIAAAPNIFVIYGLKFASGMFYQAIICSYFVYAMEFVTPRHREANGLVMGMIWILGSLYVGAVAYFFRNDSWRYFQLGVGISGLICLAYPFVLHESPRWLAANGKTEEALRVLKRASGVNGKDFVEVKHSFMAYVSHAFPSFTSQALRPIASTDFPDEVIFSESNAKDQKKINMLDLIRTPSLRKMTLITWYLFLTNVLTYFGMYMTSSNVAGNRFLNFTLLNLVEIPSVLFTCFMMKRMNRRLVMGIFFGLTALSMMTSTLLVIFADDLEGSGTASTALFIFGKFAISSSFAAVFIVAPELFPTNLRSSANGFCSGLARCGGMVAPFLRPLYDMYNWAPGLLFTVMCVLALLLTLLLPETKDTNLPDTVGEVTGKHETGNKKA